MAPWQGARRAPEASASKSSWQVARRRRAYVVCPKFPACQGWVWADRKKNCCERCSAPYPDAAAHADPGLDDRASVPDEVEVALKALEKA
eukprot:5106432-Alexandrium_andersonii.AAC.1